MSRGGYSSSFAAGNSDFFLTFCMLCVIMCVSIGGGFCYGWLTAGVPFFEPMV